MSDHPEGYWQASDGNWYPPETAPAPPLPPPPVAVHEPTPAPALQGSTCAVCGEHNLIARSKDMTEKKRPKFGLFYVLLSLTVIGFPIAIILWLIAPRKKVVIGVDRYLECQACKARQ